MTTTEATDITDLVDYTKGLYHGTSHLFRAPYYIYREEALGNRTFHPKYGWCSQRQRSIETSVSLPVGITTVLGLPMAGLAELFWDLPLDWKSIGVGAGVLATTNLLSYALDSPPEAPSEPPREQPREWRMQEQDRTESG